MLKAPIVKAKPAVLFLWAAPLKKANFLFPFEASISFAFERKSMGFVKAWVKIWNTAAIIPSSAFMPIPIYI